MSQTSGNDRQGADSPDLKRHEDAPTWAQQLARTEDGQLTKDMSIQTSQQRDTTTRLLEWRIPEILTLPNAGEDVEQQELSFAAGENAKFT